MNEFEITRRGGWGVICTVRIQRILYKIMMMMIYGVEEVVEGEEVGNTVVLILQGLEDDDDDDGNYDGNYDIY